MKSNPYFPNRKLALAIGSLTLAVGANTQTIASQSTDSQSLTIDEIIVTAQKREENLQETPIAITAMGDAEIERRGIQNTADLIGAVPSLGGFEAPSSRGNFGIGMRGISAGSPNNLSVDPANAIYVDGLYLGKQVGAAMDVAEIERIEVLRGPQGTLYGRNAIGGAINFITKKPRGEFHTKITASAGNYGMWGLKTLVDLPALELGELGQLSTNFTYQTRNRDELYENTNPNLDGFENIDRQAWRFAANWQINDNLSLDYAYDHSELDEGAQMQQLVGLTPINEFGTDRLGTLQFIQTIYGGFSQQYRDMVDATVSTYQQQLARNGKRPSKGSTDYDSFSTNESDGHIATVTWDVEGLGFLGDVTFKSITGYRESENVNQADIDAIDSSLSNGVGAVHDGILMAIGFGAMDEALLLGLVDQYGGAHSFFNQDIEYEQFSQELQMVGTQGNLDYALGLYYFEDEGSFANRNWWARPFTAVGSNSYELEGESFAVYGQVNYRPAQFEDKLTLTLGARYTEEEKNITYLYQKSGDPILAAFGFGSFDPNVLSPVPGQYDESYSDNFYNGSWLAGISYQWSDDLMTYARYSTAYRSGGFNGDIFNNPIDEETIENLEIGLKSTFLDNRMQLNLALYAYEYKDQQNSQIIVDDDGTARSLIINSGTSERWGAELELKAMLTEDLLVGLSYTFIKGDFEEYVDLCGTNICNTNTEALAKRVRSPEHAAAVTADYTLLRSAFAHFNAHLDIRWQEESYASPLWTGNYPGGAVVAYDPIILDQRTLVNAQISADDIQIGNGTLRMALSGKNLLDDDYSTFGINYAALGPIVEQYGEPRTYSFDITYEY